MFIIIIMLCGAWSFVMHRQTGISHELTRHPGITTVVTCMIVASARDTPFGGLVWPYISDTGNVYPQYAVFCESGVPYGWMAVHV